MDIDNYIKQHGTFLKATDVTSNKNALWEITGEGDLVTSEKFGVQRLHLPVKSGEDEKIFDCSKTNAKFIGESLKTADTKKWIGKFLMLEIYKTKTSDGKLTDAINVREVK